jgi:hypothetical protein
VRQLLMRPFTWWEYLLILIGLSVIMYASALMFFAWW